MLAVPEPWFEGYRETRSRSGHYPAGGARNDHIYRTRANEDVRVTVTRCGPTGVLEEHQEGRTFSRDVVYSLTPSALGTAVRVDGEVVIAVEPSAVMLAQRSRDAAAVIRGAAEAPPFEDRAVDAAMAVLALQHWDDIERGLRELVRVVRRRVVLVTMDVDVLGQLWLVRDYLPETLVAHAAAFPAIAQLLELPPGATASVIPVPRDCTDGFMAAFWGRPEAYLDPAVRAAPSPWHQIAPEAVSRALDHLGRDLASGAWDQRYGRLRRRGELDVGLPLVAAEIGEPGDAVERRPA